MKIYKIWQEVNNEYDTYDSAIVCAENKEAAKKIDPGEEGETPKTPSSYSSWCGLRDVKVKYIGEAKEGLKKGIIVASFNAG